ncbi:hypothetical protein Tco_0749187 [Tanacetum coccineum]|uniref:Uncharacterized protein n=1 Tax=Tanacetum coccineum TaxID=301880 RepID=A0ABQ4YZ04_9ASTR
MILKLSSIPTMIILGVITIRFTVTTSIYVRLYLPISSSSVRGGWRLSIQKLEDWILILSNNQDDIRHEKMLLNISSGSPTSYLDLSLPDYEAFFCDSEPDLGNFTMDVVEDISDNPTRELYVYVLHDLPTHPTLQLDSDFTISSDSLGSDLIDTLLPFSYENEDNVFNPGILASNEEKAPYLLSHRGFKAFQLISESSMMISGGDIPILDVPFLHFYPP